MLEQNSAFLMGLQSREVEILILRIVIGSGLIAISGRLIQGFPVMVSTAWTQVMSRSHLSRVEWQAILQLVIIAAIALPILPNQLVGPWQAINPRTIGELILIIAGISLVGHFAMRLFGSRAGLLATSAIGGLVSSTAVTLSFAKRARQEGQNIAILGAGISLAAAIMAVRILLEVGIVNPQLLPLLLPSMACLALVPLIAAIAIIIYVPQQEISDVPLLTDPLDLNSAIFFGLVLAVLSVLVKATEQWFGEVGVYLLSALSGITDVDALSLSLADSTLRSLSLPVGALGIFIGAAVNTVVKGVMATVIGGRSLARWCASILLVALGLGAIATAFIFS